MTLADLAGKRVAVLRAGQEGRATAEYLKKHGIASTMIDDDPAVRDESLSTDWITDGSADLTKFDVVFRTQTVPFLSKPIQQAISSGVTVTSITKLFFELSPAPIVGISGTKGKGTTTGLLNAMLAASDRKAYVGGNIGVPPLQFLDELTKDNVVILELSSFQLQDLEQSPHIAILTNLTQDHLDHHQSVGEYHAAKQSLVKYQSDDDIAIINQDDEGSRQFAKTAGGQVQWFSTDSETDAYVKDGKVVLKNGGTVCATEDIPVPGPHNLHNVLAASLAASNLEVSPSAMREAITSFRGLPYHLELVGEVDGVRFVNDSYAANPTATIPALESFSSPLIWIAGGYDRQLDFTELATAVASSSVKAVLLLGDAGKRIKEALTSAYQKADKQLPTLRTVGHKTDIVAEAFRLATPGDTVLFSPAAASFDWFDNFNQRGAYFTKAVSDL